MANSVKPLVWLEGEIKTPPFNRAARLEAGFLLRQLQLGETLSLPQSRPMFLDWTPVSRVEDTG